MQIYNLFSVTQFVSCMKQSIWSIWFVSMVPHSFSLYSYYKYHRIVKCILEVLPTLFCFLFKMTIRWGSGDFWRHSLMTWQRCTYCFSGHHTNSNLIHPPAPESVVVNIFIAWWGTLGGWHMLLLWCAFSVRCFLLGACTTIVTH